MPQGFLAAGETDVSEWEREELCCNDNWSVVELLVWMYQKFQHIALIITTACRVVEIGKHCHTNLSAHKGQGWQPSSLFQIWVHQLNATICAAHLGLYCSLLSRETASPSVSLQSTPRIVPVEEKCKSTIQSRLSQKWIDNFCLLFVSLLNTTRTLPSFYYFKIEVNKPKVLSWGRCT